MYSEMVKGICQVGIFIICAQVIVHFRPEASYEKYLKMLVSAMILIQMLRPVSGLLSKADSESLKERVARFEEELDQCMRKAALDTARGEHMREYMTLEEVRRRLEEERDREAPEEKTAPESGDGREAVEVRAVDRIEIHLGEGGTESEEAAGETGASEDRLEEMVPQG